MYWIHQRQRPYAGWRRNRGVTLLELLVVLIILSIVLGFIGAITIQVNRDYSSQEQSIRAEDSSRVALDTLARLIRMAGNDPQDIGFQALDPDPDGNLQWDSIHLRSDWNPPDGLLDDPYEDVIFSVSNNTMWIQDPATFSPVEFLDDIESLSFSYFDIDGAPVSNPPTQSGSIVQVSIRVESHLENLSPLEFSSSATIREREP